LTIKAVSKIGKEVKKTNNKNTDAIQMPFFEYLRPIIKSCRWAIKKARPKTLRLGFGLASKNANWFSLDQKEETVFLNFKKR
jgi:hypothetical protein